jgi:dienelactone hydrolase
MGGDDLYTPANECLPLLEKLKLQGKRVEWHVYPSATHAWDSEDADGRSSTTYRGDKVTFRYDRGVTEDSRKRLFDFLARHAGPPR